METAFSDLKTARQVSTALGVPFHRIDYAIQRLGLTETARVGIVRLYSPEQANLIKQAIVEITSRRANSVFAAREEVCARQ